MPNLKEEQYYHFLAWYGSAILEREKETPGQFVPIADDHDLLERAFRAGWDRATALEGQARHEAEEAEE